jgi:hypothetical protein
MRFRTTIQLEGKTATGFRVPAEVVAALDRGKRPPVRITIHEYSYRSTVAAYGDVYMLPLAAEHRVAAGVAAGDEIDVDLVLDTEPREVVVPPDLAAALDGDAGIRRRFDALSYINRRRIVLSIEEARTEATRQRRVDKAVDELRAGGIQADA